MENDGKQLNGENLCTFMADCIPYHGDFMSLLRWHFSTAISQKATRMLNCAVAEYRCSAMLHSISSGRLIETHMLYFTRYMILLQYRNCIISKFLEH
jgi:hypothetical protein